MNGIQHRLQTFIPTYHQHCLVVDTSAGLSLGTLPGLENFVAAVRPVLPLVDGLVCSPGQIGKLGALQKGDAALLVRMDWNNTLRNPDFVLPFSAVRQVPILGAQEALELGAVGMVSTFLLGYEEEVEAACLRSTVQLALEGKRLGLPLVIEIQATGNRVALAGKAVELGASYALEGGADVVVIPHPGQNSLEAIGKFVSVPWLLKPRTLDQVEQECQEALTYGAAGLWLDHTVFADRRAPDQLQSIRKLVSSNSIQE